MRERLKQMLVKEFIQALRDPRMRAVLFVMPVVQLIVFGYAVTTDVQRVPTAVYDLDRSVASRELVGRFAGSKYFAVVDYLTTESEARQALDRGQVSVVLRLNAGFENDLRAGRTAQLQVLLDGSDSNTAAIVANYAARIAAQYSENLLVARLARLRGPAATSPGVTLETRAWFNENLESIYFYVPGVVAILVTIITLLLTSMAVVREKEIGTMEQILVTPITPLEFILGSSRSGKTCVTSWTTP